MIIRTACGDIAPDELGYTDMHEHTITDMTQLVTAQQMYKDMIPPESLSGAPENMAFLRSGVGLFSDDMKTTDDLPWLIRELEIFRDKVGGNAVVDASPIPMRGDVSLIRQASEKTGVHVIVGTGLYYEKGRNEAFLRMTEDEVYAMCRREVECGIGETGVYPGFLKCGMSSGGVGTQIPECELATLRALARLAAETGMSLHVHTAVPMTHEQVIYCCDLALSYGMKPDKLYMMHLDQYLRVPYEIHDYIADFSRTRTVDITLQLALLEKGVTIGFDSWDSLVYILPDNYDRLKALIELMRRGYAGQIVLGHDVSDKSHSASYGYTGFTGFSTSCIQELYAYSDCIDPDDIDKLVYDNPARLLAF